MTGAAQLFDATKKYGSVEALKGITLDIETGEVVAMLGPNGAGKTTSISLMLGLRKPTSGTARLFGMNPTDRRARSRTGVMLQESGVPQVLKVKETIVLTTHSLEEADELAKRVVVIDHGKIIADASPEEIKSKVVGKKVTFTSPRPLKPGDLDGLPVTATEIHDQRHVLVTGEPEAVLRELFRRGLHIPHPPMTPAWLEEAFSPLPP